MLFHPRYVKLQFLRCKVVFLVIHCLEFTPINGDHGISEQVEASAQLDEGATGVFYALAIILSEISNKSLVSGVRVTTSGLGFTFQPT